MDSSNTALKLMADVLTLSTNELGLLKTMLGATPVAIQGEETLVPLSDLEAAMIGEDISLGAIEEVVESLFNNPRTIELDAGGVSIFTVIDEHAWVVSSKFLRFQLNQTFLSFLRQVARDDEVSLF